MNHDILHRALQPIVERANSLRRRTWLALFWGAALLFALLLLFVIKPGLGGAVIALCATLLAWLGVTQLARRTAVRPHEIVTDLERKHPDLEALLVTAVEQAPSSSGGLNFLQERVVTQAADEVAARQWGDTLNKKRVAFVRGLMFALAFLAFIAFATLLVRAFPNAAQPDANGLLANTTPVPPPDQAPVRDFTVEVSPGDAEVERGTRLVVSARFPKDVPAEAKLVVETEPGKTRTLPMNKNLDDPVFGAVLQAVDNSLDYKVVFGNQTAIDPDADAEESGVSADAGESDTFHLEVYELPQLLRADVTVTPPSSTTLPERTVEDTKRVRAFEGSTVAWTFQLNKPATGHIAIEPDKKEGEADLVAEPEILPLQAGATNTIVTVELKPVEETRFRLHLRDDAERGNRRPPLFTIKVQKNAPPRIEVAFPKKDAEVTPIQELPIEAKVWDDAGLTAAGATLTFAGETIDVPLSLDGFEADKKAALATLLDFEKLGAEPNQLLTYFFWAEDEDGAGEARRTESDMYFAEVRHFEEIFQEMPPMPGEPSEEQQQQMQMAQELLSDMKEVINATWKVKRSPFRSKRFTRSRRPRSKNSPNPRWSARSKRRWST